MIIWLASYPKSGNTWLRFFILSLIMGKKTNLNLNHLKAIMSYPDKSQFNGLLKNNLNLEEVAKNWINSQNRVNADQNLRFFKTHNMLGKFNNHPFTNGDNTIAVIYIVRDPRNVITSIKNHFNLDTYEEAKKFLFFERQVLSLSEEEKKKYLHKDKHPLPQFIGSWQNHFLSWKSMKKNYLLIKYENLIKDTHHEFFKISDFIGKLLNNKFSEEEVKNAIKCSNFDRLKEMEEVHGFSESSIKHDGKRNKFFYLGPKNDWKKILDKRVSTEIKNKFGDVMEELGYL